MSKKKNGSTLKRGDTFDTKKIVNVERFGNLKEGEGRNPFFVSMVAKSRITDGFMKRFFSVLFFPIQLCLFISACYQFCSISKVLYGLFGILENFQSQTREVDNIKTKKLNNFSRRTNNKKRRRK